MEERKEGCQRTGRERVGEKAGSNTGRSSEDRNETNTEDEL